MSLFIGTGVIISITTLPIPGPSGENTAIYQVFGNEATGPYGSVYDVHSDRWTLYLQDSWTIAGRFTVNAGLRAEQEYVPAYTDDPAYENAKPIDFKFKDKLAPRLGFVYDVLGDSSLKIFGSYGIYYDVFKLYVAGASFGGSKSKLASYTLDTYEWDKIGVNGYYPGTLIEVFDSLPVTLDNIDPGPEAVEPAGVFLRRGKEDHGELLGDRAPRPKEPA